MASHLETELGSLGIIIKIGGLAENQVADEAVKAVLSEPVLKARK
jgi:hypothetical protein